MVDNIRMLYTRKHGRLWNSTQVLIPNPHSFPL